MSSSARPAGWPDQLRRQCNSDYRGVSLRTRAAVGCETRGRRCTWQAHARGGFIAGAPCDPGGVALPPKSGTICRTMMNLSGRPSARLGVLLCVLGGAGCGTTGLAWVAESPASIPTSRSARDLDQPIAQPRSVAASIPATAEQERQGDARPRLSHTVTLGEIDVQSPSAASTAAGQSGVSMTVNEDNALSAPIGSYWYPSFVYGGGLSSFRDARGPTRAGNRSVSGPQAGQAWPTIADHGPSFPYRSAPASPWSRGQ